MPSIRLPSFCQNMLWVLLLGCVFCAVHHVNDWALQTVRFSPAFSPVYLPGFLRLLHVWVLGPVWGTLATAVGSLLLLTIDVNEVPTGLWLANVTASASSALLATALLPLLRHRSLAQSRLVDLMHLALLYALLNALLHHVLWSWLAPSQLVAPIQFFYMVMGDLNGVLLGGLLLRGLARQPHLIAYLHARLERADQAHP